MRGLCAGAVFMVALAAGCGSDDEATKPTDRATTGRALIGPAATRPRRDPRLYEGNVARGGELVGGPPARPSRVFVTGDPVGLRLRGPLGARVRYEVCVAGPRGRRRCLHGRTTGSDRFTALEYPARDVGSHEARWLVRGRQVAAWAYEVRPKPKPKRTRPTETIPLRERYPELRLPRRKLR